ncbi:OLC1v1036934C2 [Oldenlandia corymbosa var. corymbosa]|nr:OLC1v1036934C2 [Oldenlandia corymbosa var. corymbosa]
MGTKSLLWVHLDDLIALVGRLKAWSRKSRPLHSSGLERVFEWLQGTQAQYACIQDEADMQMIKTGILLLSSCWKHYGMLAHLADNFFRLHYRDLFNEYLSGIEPFTVNHGDEPAAEKDSAIQTIKFFLNCLSLLLGKLDGKKFEEALAEHGTMLSRVLISLFQCADEDVINSAICLFKAAIFRTHVTSSKDYSSNVRELDSVLPMLLHLLDERDGASKAVVKLVADYFSLCSGNHCLRDILKDLFSGNFSQRMNAIDMWQDIAGLLLQFLEDEEPVIQTRASELLPLLDSSLVLPGLVRLSYISNDMVESVASEALLAVLKSHKDEPEVLCLLLDNLSCLCNTSDDIGNAKGPKLDTDKVLKLLPEWSNVEDWNRMINVLFDKLFEEPSNAVVIRSCSYISDQLADAADLVFHRLLQYAAGQKDIEDGALEGKTETCQGNDSLECETSIFSHLCPLLVIRVLPLRVFDDLGSPLMYGENLIRKIKDDAGTFNLDDTECVGSLLMSRALNKFEFEDVRKLAAELCGRIHPHILIPIISSQLEVAAKAEDTMKIRACLFSICTSLLVRRKDSYQHPGMIRIRNTIKTILSWCSIGRDDVLKAQHGCIDCLAWMICSELEASKSDNAIIESSVCTHVLSVLTEDDDSSLSEPGATMQLSYRLCMANVLISACQKIPDSCRKPLARRIVQPVIAASEVTVEPEIRAACNQVLFTVVFHLKSAVRNFAPGILKVALRCLRDDLEQVRVTGAKLLASLMASEETVVERISGGLLEARTLLRSLSTSDSSADVQQLCQKLLSCMTS